MCPLLVSFPPFLSPNFFPFVSPLVSSPLVSLLFLVISSPISCHVSYSHFLSIPRFLSSPLVSYPPYPLLCILSSLSLSSLTSSPVLSFPFLFACVSSPLSSPPLSPLLNNLSPRHEECLFSLISHVTYWLKRVWRPPFRHQTHREQFKHTDPFQNVSVYFFRYEGMVGRKTISSEPDSTRRRRDERI